MNIALLLSFALTAFCGMSMSGHAVPFLYGMTKVSFAGRMHLSMSHWAYVLMGLHLGMHVPVMFAKLKFTVKLKMALSVIFCIVAGIGLFLFIRNGMPDYLFFRVPFAFLDYEKSGILVFLENILMLSFWAFIGTEVAVLCRKSQMKTEDKKNPLLPVVFIMGAIILGLVINMISGSTSGQNFDNSVLKARPGEYRQTTVEVGSFEPYSTDYNTVLMEAQEDQHNQARPELSDHVEIWMSTIRSFLVTDEAYDILKSVYEKRPFRKESPLLDQELII